jgi:hypothetical protein
MMHKTIAAIVFGVLAGTSIARADEARIGLPWDWSHRAIIHHPQLPDEAMAKGEYGEWLGKVSDPRYLSQMIKRFDAMQESAARIDASAKRGKPNPTTSNDEVHRDWSNVMGGATGVGSKGQYPAKYGFDINAAPSCAGDFVVFPTASAGATGSGAFALNYGIWTTTNGTGTVTITNGTRVLTLTASLTQNTGLFFQVANGSSTTTRAQNLGDAINRNGGVVGVIGGTGASQGFPQVAGYQAITNGTGGNSISATDSVPGFSWNATNASGGNGTAGQPTIFAVNQLYSSCGSTTQAVPATYWSYNTLTGAIVSLSPTISLDGTQVAFIEVNGTAASLVLLKWSATASVGTIGAPTTPATAGSAAAYRTCTAPCMFKFALGANDTRSAPYVDYTNDVLYVGSDDGKLHKYTGVFKGTPTAVGAPWPATVAANRLLSPPVYDSVSNLVFVGSDRDGTTTGGRLHSVNATSGAVVSSGVLAGNPGAGQPAGSTGVADMPMVDSSAQRVYAFVGTDNSANCGGVNCQAVYQFPTTTSINGLTTPMVQVGRGQIYNRILYTGTFDNGYWNSANSASPSGFLYVCGSLADGSTSQQPTLWRIPINANAMGTPVAGPTVVTANAGECAPVSEVANGTHDYIFTSVPANGIPNGTPTTRCAAGCIYMFDLSTIATWGAGIAPSASLPAAGGTGAIIIDNINSTAGASQVYYSTLTSPGNAIQASQAALQ